MFLLALRNLRAHPLRSLLTALAIALGVAMVLAAASVSQTVNERSVRLEQQSQSQNFAGALGDKTAAAPSFNTLTLQAMLVLVGVIILFAAGFVIANAFGMSLAARQKELGALRALGMTRAQVLQTVLWEACALGAVGAIVGVPLGLGIAWVTLWVIGFASTFAMPAWALALSSALGFIVTLVSALLPARQASLASPLDSLRPEARPAHYSSRPAQLALIALVVLLIVIILFGSLAKPDWLTVFSILLPAMVVMLGAVALMMPALVRPMARAARPWLQRFFGTAGRLAADNLQRNPQRAALTAGAMTAGVTMMIAASGLFTAAIKGGLLTFATLVHEDRIVVFNITDAQEFRWDNSLQAFLEAAPLNPELRTRLQTLADEGLIELQRIDMAPVPTELGAVPNYPGVFVDPEPYIRHGDFDFFEGSPAEALQIIARGPAVLISPTAAERLKVHVGDALPVQTSIGQVNFTVAGIGGTFWVMAAFPYADGQKYFGVAEPPFLGVYVREGHDRAQVLKQVDDIVADYSGSVSWNIKDGFGEFYRLIDQIVLLLDALLLMAVVIAALGVVNTMMINVAERQREIGMLRATGATRRQVRQMVMAEGATLGLFSVFVAALVSLLIVVAYVALGSPNAVQSLGFRLTPQVFQNAFAPVLPVMGSATLAALVLVPLIAALAAYYPAKQAAAQDVAEATRSEELSLRPTPTRRAEGENMDDRRPPHSLPLFLAQKNLEQQRTRAILSLIAIALGATMTVAGDVLSQSIIGVVTRTEDLRAIGEGLWSQLDPAFKGIGAGIMLAAGFLVFNTFAMSITQRRQQIGALRSLGMTRAQVWRMVLTEALVIGGAGTLMGLILGPALGQGIIAFMRSLDNPVLNSFAPSQPTIFSFILAAVMGLGVTLIASLMPARQAMSLSPLTALKAPDLGGVPRSPVRLGLIGLALCLLLAMYLILSPPALWLQPPYDQIAAFAIGALWISGIALALPLLVDVVAISLRGLFRAFRLSSAVFRLLTDNFQRGRGRVLLTIVTLAISLTMIGALTGFIQFYLFEFFGPKFDALKQENAWVVSMMNIEAGLAGYTDMESLRLPPEVLAAMRETAGERGNFTPFGFVIVPELSFMGDTYFSFILNPRALREVGSLFMTFKQGDWETALPIMENGCGLLMTPAIAARNNVSEVGDTLMVTSKYGPVTCTVAGIGSTFVGATIISEAAQDSFDRGQPFSLFIQARPGVDQTQFEADLQKTADRYGAHMLRMSGFTETMLSIFDNVPVLFNAFLLMAVLAAALGVVNTTLISVTERRREFGQLRALGATRAQVRAVVVGEAALMGLLGGLVGLLASVGLTVIFATVYGGSTVGVDNYQPWAAAFRTLPKVLPTGLVGIVASPLICALAAYFPANSILRGAAIETLQPEAQQPLTRQRIVGVLQSGSIQTRFTLGTALLLVVVLAALIQVITSHARNYLLAQITDSVRAMVGWNATTVELALSPDAQTIDLAQLQATSGQAFDASALLRFRSLMDDLSAGGLEAFVVTDQNNMVIASFEQGDIGDTLEPLDDSQKITVRETRVEGEAVSRLSATAPIRNQAGETVGSLRLTLRLTDLQDFLNRVRNILWTAGAAIIALGLLLSWWLSRPFTRAARTLATHASRVTRGDYSPLTNRRNSPILQFSIRARLTFLMTLLVILLVGGMGFIVIPIEREELASTTKEGMLTAMQWMGDFISASFPTEVAAPPNVDLARILQMGQSLDFGKLQELTEQTRGQNMAYLAITDASGNIVLSDKLALIGEAGITATQPQITEGVWRDAPIWLASTPLRWGREGEQIGTLSAGIDRTGIESFLDEARNLFWLTGLSAVLAGLLLAQVLGSAVAAPVENLVSGARRVAGGDLSVKFGRGEPLQRNASTADELSQLAAAFNQMVAGLREREKLRDLFGKFVSPEVREAIESGRVTLAGERKTITVLYCDMRGSTSFAERHKPEEVMSALNQYFEVIVLAVEAHGGIINRFVGDEAVCVFGAPTETPDHAERAVSAALAIRAGLHYLNHKREAASLPTLKFGMGINTGEVVAGATGSEERQEYTLIGDAMNLGARIQDLNKTFPEYAILLSEYTRAALAGHYALSDLGAVEIRGKSQPVRVFGIADL